jgi:hypothetical protein
MNKTNFLMAEKASAPRPSIAPVGAPPPVGGALPGAQPSGGVVIAPPISLDGSRFHFYPVSTPDILVFSGLVVFFALVALLPRSLIARHLVAQRATPGSASAAGWTFWFFIVSLFGVILAGWMGNLWTNYYVIGPAGGLVVALLVLFLIMYSSASRTHR